MLMTEGLGLDSIFLASSVSGCGDISDRWGEDCWLRFTGGMPGSRAAQAVGTGSISFVSDLWALGSGPPAM